MFHSNTDIIVTIIIIFVYRLQTVDLLREMRNELLIGSGHFYEQFLNVSLVI